MAEKLLRVEEAADRVGYRVSTVRDKILKRQWPFVRMGRSVRIRQSFIERLIQDGEVPARKSA